ncbi:hypothetical protein LguiA_026140 [Lonicera macranthoides]
MAISLERELNQVLFEEVFGVRKIILNRPKKLNSLKHEMICQMLKKLELYENHPAVNLIILKANGNAFCAGGDVKAAFSFITAGHWSFGASFYRKQLTLDYLLGTYKKPVVALINGIVMGGGAGISMHARFRIVTEKTIFAMPEVSIGLFPDVGASHFLSRLPCFLGEYLGLTGARLDGKAMLTCGLATHFVLSKDLASLENAIDIAASSNVFNISTILAIVNKYSQKGILTLDNIPSRLETINKCFSRETVEEILSSLEGVISTKAEKWILDAINSMKTSSPTSLKLFLRSIRDGRAQKLDQCLIREFNILCQMMRRTISEDFFEGCRAMLIDKDKNPHWVPSKLELVNEDMVHNFFFNVEDEEWEPLKLPSRSNLSYPMLSSRL